MYTYIIEAVFKPHSSIQSPNPPWFHDTPHRKIFYLTYIIPRDMHSVVHSSFQLIEHVRAGTAQHYSGLGLNHRWPQVCPVSVVPRQLIAFLVGLNVGWTQTLSYDSYDSSYDWYLYKYSILLYVIWVNTLWNRMKATAISWNQSHLSKRQSGNLGVTSLDDGEGLGWHLLNLGNLSAQIPPTRSARLRDVERWNREPKRHLTMRFTPSNLYYSVTSQLRTSCF